MKILLYLFFCLSLFGVNAQTSVSLGLLKYNGGGDWYANPTALPNLISFCNENLSTNINSEPVTVDVSSPEIFNYPFIHMTGHGNVVFSEQALDNLRTYLQAGGFLHIDDNYGMDKYIRREILRLFPEQKLVELPFSHPVFKQAYPFKNGLPKIHEHDKKPPQAFGILLEGKLVLLYTYETDLGDGWEDQSVHNDPEEKRLQALKMGANIIMYAFGE